MKLALKTKCKWFWKYLVYGSWPEDGATCDLKATIQPEGNMNVCIKLHCDTQSETHSNMDLMVVLEDKSGIIKSL